MNTGARHKALPALLLLLIAACSGTPRDAGDGPPSTPTQDPWAAPEPRPARLPRSRYGNPESYVVFGKKYRVMDSSSGFRQRGLASWYGRKFHGRRTSSGEIFDMYALTGAHRELPIPCIARVTNLGNGRSLLIRINDRGPFHPDRVLDLSWAAATRLGLMPSGTAEVELVVVESDDPAFVPAAMTPQRSADIAWPPEETAPSPRPSQHYLQVGAFRDARLAEQAVQRFRGMGYPVAPDAPRSGGWTRVWLGPWPDPLAAETVAADLARRNLPSLLIAQ